MGESILDKHPPTLMDRMRPDGTVKPFTIEEQWKRTSQWHQFLGEAEQADEYDAMDAYIDAWRELEPLYQFNGHSVIERGAELERVSGSPLSTLFYMIDMGMYPPPELLLTLLDCWKTYMHNNGELSLEQAFLGKPVQKAGNYAQRTTSRFRKLFVQFEFSRKVRDGLTREQAAERVAEMVGGRLDADSIKRMARMPKKQK